MTLGLGFRALEIRSVQGDDAANALLAIETYVSGPGGMDMRPAWQYVMSVGVGMDTMVRHVLVRIYEIRQPPEQGHPTEPRNG